MSLTETCFYSRLYGIHITHRYEMKGTFKLEAHLVLVLSLLKLHFLKSFKSTAYLFFLGNQAENILSQKKVVKKRRPNSHYILTSVNCFVNVRFMVQQWVSFQSSSLCQCGIAWSQSCSALQLQVKPAAFSTGITIEIPIGIFKEFRGHLH